MRIIINDSSALIDLAKTRLLENLLRLPCRFVIPDVLYADELITLHHYRREQLVPGDVISGKARAHAPASWACTPQPDCMTSAWATVEKTWPTNPQNLTAPIVRRIDPQWMGFGTLDRRGSEATTNLSSIVTNVKAGDILLAVVQRQYQANCTGVAAGSLAFTKLATASSGQSGLNVELWGSIATADAATLTVTALYSNSSTFGAMFVARYAGGIVGMTPLAKTAHTTLRATSINVSTMAMPEKMAPATK